MAEAAQARIAAASEIETTRPEEASKEFRAVALGDCPNTTDGIKAKESAIQKLTDLYVKTGDAKALRALLSDLRPLFGVIPKAKTAKVVRTIIDSIAKVPDSTQLQLEVCKEQVEWARQEKRNFLRQRIEARLANLYLESREFSAALALIGSLLKEVKRLDDKLLLVDIHLLESRVHHALRNIPRARAALTAARTAANAVYIPPGLQAEIDTQSGLLHAEERDYKTAYSYFYEAFEQSSAMDDSKAVYKLKYMLLCKIMTNDAEDVPSIINSKGSVKYVGMEVDAMKAVAKAYQDRSLQGFQEAQEQYSEQLDGDPVVHSHLSVLYDTLLEQNLCRLIEPFSRVEIEHIAKLIELDRRLVERKLSQMILDKKISGTLDQGTGCLEVFEEPIEDGVYPAALDTYENMSKVVDILFARSQKIMA
ncbi:hypothetical protein BSKO_04158 [Bryopsis sp. KO-2023]|nr:hypothetical protein BSKO_04158 [Bryopsis sp. KO-2023]